MSCCFSSNIVHGAIKLIARWLHDWPTWFTSINDASSHVWRAVVQHCKSIPLMRTFHSSSTLSLIIQLITPLDLWKVHRDIEYDYTQHVHLYMSCGSIFAELYVGLCYFVMMVTSKPDLLILVSNDKVSLWKIWTCLTCIVFHIFTRFHSDCIVRQRVGS